MEFKQLINQLPSKKQIRQDLLVKRRQYPNDQKKHDDMIITRTLLALDIIQNANAICTYVSMQDEIDTISFIKSIFKKSHSAVIVPKVESNILKLFRIIDLKHLKESSFGVLEPDNTCQQIPLDYPDIFITPGIAFSQDGHRIGYGRGYYDWLFSKTNVVRIAIAYDFQVLETIPYEDYDRQVDLIITPTRIINCTKRIKL